MIFLKEKSNDLENEAIRLRSQVKQKDQEILDVKKLTDQLQNERGKVTDIVRQEFADRLDKSLLVFVTVNESSAPSFISNRYTMLFHFNVRPIARIPSK